jgi:hypothetical protein
MIKAIIITLLVLMVPASMVTVIILQSADHGDKEITYVAQTHKCTDSTHATCDGECVCDGMECPKY